ncbi:MaoC/PaaZ C-terminal domain-containing protein [Pseudonocardia nigra]|uniref:MaoC/PaaZ C-terminal domain-containing protein n=1 Tax=Pseudonocardia nigra TaxID=1921578 RepID=UPI001C5D4794|nr:MaoC/PaaZ C-terminal domain-containing protein [Pseudonocardia nigra]
MARIDVAAAAAAKAGDELPGRVVGPLTRMDFARFSVATDDPNRVHVEEEVAAAAGFPHVIGSGGIVTGVLTDVVTAWAGLEAVTSGSTRMFAPLFPGVTLRASGSVTGRDDNGNLTVHVVVDDEAGTRVGEGTFAVRQMS